MTLFLHLLYRAYRLITWSTFWTKRRFTVMGQAMIGAVIVALFTGLDAESAVGYQAFIPLFALLLISLVFGFYFRAGFQVERHLPRVVTAGQLITYRVSVKNITQKNQIGLTIMEDLVDPRPTFSQWREYKLDEDKHVRPFRFERRNFRSPFKMATVKEARVPDLIPQQEKDFNIELSPLRRGVVRFTGVTFARPDPMGIYRALRKQLLPQSLLVLPKRYAIPPIALPGSMKYQQGGVAMASHIGQSEEFVSLREYRRGDPPRHIHWRSWARIGKPIVKEFKMNSSSVTHWCWTRSRRVRIATYLKKLCLWPRRSLARFSHRNRCLIFCSSGRRRIVLQRAAASRTRIRCWRSWRPFNPQADKPSACSNIWC